MQALVMQMGATPKVEVKELGEGPALVEGRAAAIQQLEAPITGLEVIGYQIIFDLELRSGAKRRLNIARVAEFQVQDATGSVMVDTSAGATLILGHEYSADSAAVGSAAGPIMVLLARELDQATMSSLTGNFTWHMFYLQHGEPATVCGEVGRVLHGETGRPAHYRDNAFAPSLRKPTPGALIISDMHRSRLLDYITASAT